VTSPTKVKYLTPATFLLTPTTFDMSIIVYLCFLRKSWLVFLASYSSVSSSSVASAHLTIFKNLASGTSAELTLITSRISSTLTLAKQTLTPNAKGERIQI